MPHTSVGPDRHTRYDTDLRTNVRGYHGAHAYCACGWQGQGRKTWQEAQADAREHRGWHRWIEGER